MNLILFLLLIICVFYALSLCKEPSRGYYWFLPAQGIPSDDLRLVEEAVQSRTPSDILFHQKTDRSVSPAFLELLESHGILDDIESLDKLVITHVPTILRYKLFHNRKRPWQMNPCLDKLDSVSANNPSYPSGHAYQAWVLYKHLSQKYPGLEHELYAMAERCSNIRVIAGLHFPSDGQYSKQLVMKNIH